MLLDGFVTVESSVYIYLHETQSFCFTNKKSIIALVYAMLSPRKANTFFANHATNETNLTRCEYANGVEDDEDTRDLSPKLQ